MTFLDTNSLLIHAELNREIKKLKNIKITYEMIIINDGSKDKTSKILKDLKKQNKNIKILQKKIRFFLISIYLHAETNVESLI